MPLAPTYTPTSRILGALAFEEPLVEITLVNRFGESLPIRRLLQFWQVDERIHALLAASGLHHAFATLTVPPKVAQSETYVALAGSAVGFVVQFATLTACRDPWGKQALLEYPTSSHGLWRALVWAGTGSRPGLGRAAAGFSVPYPDGRWVDRPRRRAERSVPALTKSP